MEQQVPKVTPGVGPFFTLEEVDPILRNGKVVKYQSRITVGRAAELLERQLIWVDYDYQRGIKVAYGKDGTIKSREPNVDRWRVDEIADKILRNELYGGALTWSLRTNEVKFAYDQQARTLRIMAGRPTIPDSNHRHQAMLKVCQIVKEKGIAFDPDSYEFPLMIEVLDLEQERGLFFEYNQLARPANPTRSKWVNQADQHNRLNSRVIEASTLNGHVEIVKNTISVNSPMVVTFNTLAKGLKEAFPDLDEENFGEIKDFLVSYIDCLTTIRSEIGYLPLSARKAARGSSIGDSALVFNAYMRLAGDLRLTSEWKTHLARLKDQYHYAGGGVVWEGDLMSRENPLWKGTVLLTGKSGKPQISNRNETRAYVYDKLREVVGIK